MTHVLGRALSALFIESLAVIAFVWFISSSGSDGSHARDRPHAKPATGSNTLKGNVLDFLSGLWRESASQQTRSERAAFVERTLDGSAKAANALTDHLFDRTMSDLFGGSERPSHD